MSVRIGIDFDNTIVTYDRVFHKYALQRGWITPGTPVTKRAIRDAIRQSTGNDAWTELQAMVYGEAIAEAEKADGLEPFLKWIEKENIPAVIISHKTTYSAIGQTNLRAPAEVWLRAQGLKMPVYFEETREEKFDRIRDCQVTHFIDDLEEVLGDRGFPAGVEKIYYNPGNLSCHDQALQNCLHWQDILKYFQGMPKTP